MNTYNSFADLELKIVRWAEARSIMQNSNMQAQAQKTLEECGELLEAAANLRILESFLADNPDVAIRPQFVELRQKCEAAYRDAIGDIAVTLIVGCATADVPFVECLAGAYDEIKDRRGHLRADGVFVKEV